jgi:transposase
LWTTSASPHEVTLVEQTLDHRFTADQPQRLIGDKAYDSDQLDQRLLETRDIEMIAPHITRANRKQVTQDGRPMRRYRRRWKVERLIAWLHNFRRTVTRWDYHPENYNGFVLLGCAIILLRQF